MNTKYHRFKDDGRKLIVCPRCKNRRIANTLVVCSNCKKQLRLKGDWMTAWKNEQQPENQVAE